MANIAHVTRLDAPVTRRKQAIGSVRFTWVMIALLGWFLGGLYLDGWAHNHGMVDQSFFTPWHAVFYSGFAAAAGGLGGMLAYNRSRGYSWRQAIPVGYELALVGAAIFAAGGIFDLVWHTLFGIEENFEALLSPSHLLLAFGMALTLSAPLRAAWRLRSHPGKQDMLSLLPALLSLTFTLSLITFMTQFLHPFVRVWPATTRLGEVGQALGIAGCLLQTALLMGFVLVAMQRWTLPLGSLTLVFELNAILMSSLADTSPMIPVAVLAGLGADLLLKILQPSAARPGKLRVFAFVVPVLLYAFYFLVLALAAGITWSLHMWTGTIVLAGFAGWLMSYAIVPPRILAETREPGSVQ